MAPDENSSATALREPLAEPPIAGRIGAFFLHPFPWLIIAVAIAFVTLPALDGDVQLRESLLLAAVYITLASNLNLMMAMPAM
jgi:hypothetical protein